MTATVPEDIQISLGTIYKSADTASDNESFALNKSTGWLLADSNGVATAPRGVTVGADNAITVAANDELDWSNTADISAYYSFGKLIPASSTSGQNVYYTPDADGVGKTVKTGAAFYQAAAGGTAYKAGTNAATNITDDTSAKATSHIFSTTEKTAAATHTWAARSDSNTKGYKTATDYANTNDDGYYIDIPVWLRTSSTEAQNIFVTGYVKKGSGTTDSDTDDVLYQSVRVAILDGGTYGAGSGSGESAVAGVNGCVLLKDGATSATYPTNKLTATGATGATSILDSDNYNTRQTTPLTSGVYALNATTGDNMWAAITQNDGDDSVCTLAAGTGQEYGVSSKLIIRVWLEGEDGDCWNENAGQDWDISLKFMKTALTAATGN